MHTFYWSEAHGLLDGYYCVVKLGCWTWSAYFSLLLRGAPAACHWGFLAWIIESVMWILEKPLSFKRELIKSWVVWPIKFWPSCKFTIKLRSPFCLSALNNNFQVSLSYKFAVALNSWVLSIKSKELGANTCNS